MSKKVLIISSSPRANGNGELLCNEFLKGAKDGGHQVELALLRKLKMSPCIACSHCRKNDGVCVFKDDVEKVIDQMIEADVIVLATPVYFYSMSAQLKMLIDRTYGRYTQIKSKEIYIMITAADRGRASMVGTIEAVRGFITCLPGAKEKGIVYGLGAWAKGDIENLEVLKEAYQVGKDV